MATMTSRAEAEEPHLVTALGNTWAVEVQCTRTFVGRVAVEVELHVRPPIEPFRATVLEVMRGLCGAVIADPPTTLTADRSDDFRVHIQGFAFAADGRTPRAMGPPTPFAIRHGACDPVLRRGLVFRPYPVALAEWLFDRGGVSGDGTLIAIFRPLGDQRLDSLDAVAVCRAALFDLPEMNEPLRKALPEAISIAILAERGRRGGFVSAWRNVGWRVPLGPDGCGDTAVAVEL
ncbi:MAG: hypothetical protein ACU0CO_07265 [Shimia sp.]